MSITRTDLLARARSALGHSITYRLGGGTDHPDAFSPADDENTCDCSQFICWALQLHKFERGRAWLAAVNGGSFNTDGVWWDAVKTELGIFNLVGWVEGKWWSPTAEHAPSEGARLSKPGDLIVYPAAWVVRGARLQPPRAPASNPSVGHIMMITDPIPDAEGRPLIIDCSAADRANAIREHRWLPKHPAAVVARCTLVVD